jgi:hypothetical protein
MANNQIDVTIRANDQTNQGIETAKRQIESFKESQRQALGQHREDVERARGAAELLGAQFGITIPRELRKVIAESAGVGKALSAAFTVAAAVGFLEIADKIVDKFLELATAVKGFSEAEQAAMNKAFANSTAYLRMKNEELQTARAKALADAQTPEARRALSDQFALEDVGRNRDAANEAKRQWDEATRAANEFSKFSNAEDRNRDGGPFGLNKFLGPVGAYRDVKKFFEDIESATKAHKEAVDAATASRDKYYEAEANVQVALRGVVKVQEDANKAFDEAKKKADDAYRQGIEAAIDRAAQAARFLTAELEQHIKKIAEVKSAGKDMNAADALGQAEGQLRFFELAFKLQPEDQGLIREGVDFWRTEVEKQTKRLNSEIGAAGAAAGKSWADRFVSEISKIKEKTLPHLGPSLLGIGETAGQDPRQMSISSEPKFDEMSAQMKTIQSISQEVGDGFTTMFSELVDGTHSVSDAFANMARAVAASITAMIAKMIVMAAVERIVGAAIGAFGGGGGFHSGGTATVLSQDAFGMTLAGTRAGGGFVSANMPYLVGERGPERFVPGTSGTIVPNGGFGGSSVQVNIINETGSQVRKSESAPQFDGKKWVQNIILEDVASNGPIGQAWKSRR